MAARPAEEGGRAGQLTLERLLTSDAVHCSLLHVVPACRLPTNAELFPCPQQTLYRALARATACRAPPMPCCACTAAARPALPETSGCTVPASLRCSWTREWRRGRGQAAAAGHDGSVAGSLLRPSVWSLACQPSPGLPQPSTLAWPAPTCPSLLATPTSTQPGVQAGSAHPRPPSLSVRGQRGSGVPVGRPAGRSCAGRLPHV